MLKLILPLALAAAPASADAHTYTGAGSGADAPLTALDQLPIEEATGPRCAIGFAVVARWQNADDPRGTDFADLRGEGASEFFVRAMARLMDDRGLTRDNIQQLVIHEAQRFSTPQGREQLAAIMPACLLAKQAAGL